MKIHSTGDFHAQPVACPVCGPQVWLEDAQGHQMAGPAEAIPLAQKLLAEGKILAIKGLGGFHLACDATNSLAVAELRRRKLRVDKPFALMMANMEEIERNCMVSPGEADLLQSHQRPIILLRAQPGSSIAQEVAPGQLDSWSHVALHPLALFVIPFLRSSRIRIRYRRRWS